MQPMSSSLGLFRLQQVDSQIDRARSRLNIIQKTIDNDKKLKNANTHFETVNNENALALRNAKNAETETKDLRIKIEQTESSLYSGNVKNPKELQDLQLEIVSLKKHLITLEERELESMLLSETATAELEKAKAELENVQANVYNEHKILLDEKAELIKQMESLAQEREATRAPIESPLFAVYETLRQQKRGIAVAEVDDNACSACGTDLNAALQQSARSQKQLAYCPSCGRILFAN